jgi:hypothetical protein
VVAWEPLPLRGAFLQYALQANNVSHLVQLRPRLATSAEQLQRGAAFQLFWQPHSPWGELTVQAAPAGAAPGSKAPTVAGNSVVAAGEALDQVVPGLAAAAGQGAAGAAQAAQGRRGRALSAAAEWVLSQVGAAKAAARLLSAAQQEGGDEEGDEQQQQQQWEPSLGPGLELDSIALLKVSADGGEPEALAGAQQLLASGAVENLLLDYNIGGWGAAGERAAAGA